MQYDVPADIPPPPARHPLERNRWDADISSRGRQSSRNVQRTFSRSRSRSRSREGYSPSPTHSHDFEDFFRPRSHLPSDVQDHDYQSRPYNKSSKGKQSSALFRPDTWRPRDHVDRYSPHDGASSAHAERSSRHGRNKPSSPVREISSYYSPTSHDDGDHDVRRSAGSRNYRSEALPTAPLPTSNGSVNKSREIPGDIPIAKQSRESAKPSESPLPSDQTSDALKPVWGGISIKGQAKLLDRKDEQGTSESCRTADVTKDERVKNINISSIPQKRSRNPTDLLHAHLTTVPLGRGFKTAAVASNDINQSSTKKVSRVTINGVSRYGSCFVTEQENFKIANNNLCSDKYCSDQPNQTDKILPQTHVPPPSSGASAPNIMARTRAKLAKLRAVPSQKPLIDVVPSAPSSANLNVFGNNSSSAPDMRVRLAQRLEEEKRLACQSDKGIQHPARSSTGGAGNSLPSQAEQLEKRLRAQALLRVAAEKSIQIRPAGGDAAVTREDVLKARLLSRRT